MNRYEDDQQCYGLRVQNWTVKVFREGEEAYSFLLENPYQEGFRSKETHPTSWKALELGVTWLLMESVERERASHQEVLQQLQVIRERCGDGLDIEEVLGNARKDSVAQDKPSRSPEDD